MKRRYRGATWLFVAALTIVAALVGATAAAAEGGGQNRFPCTSTTIRPGALLPDLVPDQQLLADDHVVWRDPQTGQVLASAQQFKPKTGSKILRGLRGAVIGLMTGVF